MKDVDFAQKKKVLLGPRIDKGNGSSAAGLQKASAASRPRTAAPGAFAGQARGHPPAQSSSPGPARRGCSAGLGIRASARGSRPCPPASSPAATLPTTVTTAPHSPAAASRPQRAFLSPAPTPAPAALCPNPAAPLPHHDPFSSKLPMSSLSAPDTHLTTPTLSTLGRPTAPPAGKVPRQPRSRPRPHASPRQPCARRGERPGREPSLHSAGAGQSRSAARPPDPARVRPTGTRARKGRRGRAGHRVRQAGTGRVWSEHGPAGLGLRARVALPRDPGRVGGVPAPGSAGSLPRAAGRWRPGSRRGAGRRSRISRQPRLQLGPGEKPGLEHLCPPARFPRRRLDRGLAAPGGAGRGSAGKNGTGIPGTGGLALGSVSRFGGNGRRGLPGEGDRAGEGLGSA